MWWIKILGIYKKIEQKACQTRVWWGEHGKSNINSRKERNKNIRLNLLFVGERYPNRTN